MNNIVSRNSIIRDRLKNVKEGNLVLELFKLAEEYGIGQEIELQNQFSFEALNYVTEAYNKKSIIQIERIYKGINNVYYVTELFLRGYYIEEKNMDYEEFLLLVKTGRSREVIEKCEKCFYLHINRLKKVIAKSRRKLDMNSRCFTNTRNFLNELDRDLSKCENYPALSATLSEFYTGRNYGLCKPAMVKKLSGFLAIEKTVYSLYNEIGIITNFNTSYIQRIYDLYVEHMGMNLPFNLFEKVINNYLFAQLYSETPENLCISKIDADLILREIKSSSIDVSELVKGIIDKYELSDFEKKYLGEYAVNLQKRIDSFMAYGYFAELFLVMPPD